MTTSAIQITTDSDIPLVVDLDGTFLRVNTVIESWWHLLKTDPYFAFHALPLLLTSTTTFTYFFSSKSTLDLSLLPLNEQLFSYLRNEKQNGTMLILATGASEPIAKKVVEHYKIFDHYIASTSSIYMIGQTKLRAIESSYPNGFRYAGNDWPDLFLWSQAFQIIFVNTPSRLQKKARQTAKNLDPNEPILEFDPPPPRKVILKALRVHQWSKNLLLFLPILTARRYKDLIHPNLFFTFVMFSCMSSAVYLLNDLADLDSDRRHPSKKHRPIAAGHLSILDALKLSLLGFVMAGVVLYVLPIEVFFCAAIYLSLSTAYTFFFKQYPMVDVFILSILYILRIYTGAAAISIEVTSWLTFFSFFFFLSLAVGKRASELIDATDQRYQIFGRGYRHQDLGFLTTLGMTSGHIAIAILCGYSEHAVISGIYENRLSLWLVCLIIYFWTMRLWFFIQKGTMHLDPVAFALKDSTTHLCFLFCLILGVLA